MHPIDTLLARLDLDRLDRDVYRGHTPNDGRQRVFGGLVAAQALIAAYRTVDETDKFAHSLHGYFLRPGDPRGPILFDVDRIRDGKSFATRRIVARQEGEAIFNMSVSFHVHEEGLSHQERMPDTPPPDGLKSNSERLAEYAEQTSNPVFPFLLRLERPIEHRDPEPIDLLHPQPHRGLKRLWFRGAGRIPDNQALHQAVVTYASDMGLLDNCIQHHGHTWLDPNLMIASLDHALWFHRPLRADDWLLYSMKSPNAEGGRGFNTGRMYAADGTLVASVAQESLMRVKRDS
jgi:acyl-CoA thioesterase-2